MPRGFPSTTCFLCHRFHVQCVRESPNEPCNKCKHRGTECVMKPHKVYRGPGKKNPDSVSSSASGVSTSPGTTLAQTQAEFPQAPVEFDSSWVFPSPVSPFGQTSLLDFADSDTVSPSEVSPTTAALGSANDRRSEAENRTRAGSPSSASHPQPWAATIQAQAQTWAASVQSQNQTRAASVQAQNQTSVQVQNQARTASTQVHAQSGAPSTQGRARAAPEPQRWLLSNFTPLHGIKEKEILAGFPEFPLFQAMQHEAEVIFDKYRNKRPTIVDPAKVDVGFLELLRNKAQGLPLAKVPDLSVIAMYIKMRSFIHAMGTFFHDLDDETLLVFFRAYLTPAHATFTEHDVIRRHGFGYLVQQRGIDEPDYVISRDIAAAVDKDSARDMREVVLHRFRTIEYHANLEGLICILLKVYNAGIVHKVVDCHKPLQRVFLPLVSREFELSFVSGIINEVPKDLEHNPLTFDLANPRVRAMCHPMLAVNHRLIRDEYVAELQRKSKNSDIIHYLQLWTCV